MNNGIVRVLVVAAAAAAGTWLAGWWAVPVVALIAGLLTWPASTVALGCGLAWAILLIVNAAAGGMSRVAGVLGDLMGLPAPALVAITIFFPAVLGWSAATLGGAARVILSPSAQDDITATSRRPS